MSIKPKYQMLFIFLVSCVFTFSSYAASENNTNFRFNPLVVLLGGVTATMDFKIHPQWTVGPEASLTSFKLTSSTGPSNDTAVQTYSLTGRGNWFRQGVFTTGMYVGPFVTYASAKARLNDGNRDPVEKKAHGVFTGAIIGYGWFWKTFNVMLGGGLTLPLGTSKVDVENSTGARTDAYINGSGIAILEFSLGWTF